MYGRHGALPATETVAFTPAFRMLIGVVERVSPRLGPPDGRSAPGDKGYNARDLIEGVCGNGTAKKATESSAERPKRKKMIESLLKRCYLLCITALIFSNAAAVDRQERVEADAPSPKLEPARTAAGESEGTPSDAPTTGTTAGGERKAGSDKTEGLIVDNRKQNFNISRLQVRATDDGTLGFTQSTFYRFTNGMYLAEAYDYREGDEGDPDFKNLAVNVGGPLTQDQVWEGVVRAQYATQADDVYSVGIQANLTRLDALKYAKERFKLTTFVQLFTLRSNDSQGDWDVLWYYSFPLYKKLYLRGVTSFIKFDDEKDYVRSYQDIIYPLRPDLDVYVRADYQNRDDVQFGKIGTQYALGVRYNFSF